jgi:hypothetical protein
MSSSPTGPRPATGFSPAVRFLTAARTRGKTVAEFAAAMQRFPQVLRSIRVARKEALSDAKAVLGRGPTRRGQLGSSGRVLVSELREPSLSFEGRSRPRLKSWRAHTHATAISERLRTSLT